MPAKFEQFANNAITSLTSLLLNTATSFTVDSAADFPTDGNFHILIDDEIILVTAVAGSVFTVERGQEGTADVTHNAGALVTLIVTKESFRRLGSDQIPFFGVETTPGPLNSLTDTNGAALNTASFTWRNQGTSTATDISVGTDVVGISLKPQTGTGANLRILERVAPTAPYTIYAAFSTNFSDPTTVNHAGLCFVENSSGKVVPTALSHDSTPATATGVFVADFLSVTDGAAVVNVRKEWGWNPNLTWCYIQDNNTNISYGISSNGLEFTEVWSRARGTFFTGSAPDRVGFYFNTNDASIQQAILLNHWSEQ